MLTRLAVPPGLSTFGLREHLVQCLLLQLSLQAAPGLAVRTLQLQATPAAHLLGCRVFPLLPLGAEPSAGQSFAGRTNEAVGGFIVGK
jgi:hypothetical protein